MKLSRRRPLMMSVVEFIPSFNWYLLDQYLADSPTDWSGIDIGDIDGDGVQEIVLCGRNTVRIFRVVGDLLVQVANWNPTVEIAEIVLVTDINNDGIKELIIVGFKSTPLTAYIETWQWNGTTPIQLHVTNYTGNAQAWNAGYGNLDGTGNKIIIESYLSPNITVRVYSSDLSAYDTITFGGVTTSRSMAIPKINVADFDGDGILEFAVGGSLDGVGFIKLFTWDATNKIVLKKTITSAVTPSEYVGASLQDWNGDGINEILVHGYETVTGTMNALLRIYSMNFATILAQKLWNYGNCEIYSTYSYKFAGTRGLDILACGTDYTVASQFADILRFRGNTITLLNHLALPKMPTDPLFAEQAMLYDFDSAGFPLMVVEGWDNEATHKSWIGLYKSASPAPAIPTLTFTATTTSAQTVTFAYLTASSGRMVTIDWGDGTTIVNSDTSGSTSHAYSGAGTWTIQISNSNYLGMLSCTDAKVSATITAGNPIPPNLTYLRFDGPTVSWTVGASTPMPTGLTTYLELSSQPNIYWAVGASAPMPTGLTSLRLYSLTHVTWTVGASAPMPTGLTTLYFYNVPNAIWVIGADALIPAGITSLTLYSSAGISGTIGSAAPLPTGLQTLTLVAVLGSLSVESGQWSLINSIRTIRYEKSLNQVTVDAILQAIWANKANYTFATPSLDLLGDSNATPSGVYQLADPPTTGQEYKYALINTAPGNNWTVTTA